MKHGFISSLVVCVLVWGAGCEMELKLKESSSAVPAGAFSRLTVDLGVVVSDLEKSARFYTEAVGFEETKGFSVSAVTARDAGLTDNLPATIRVFRLGEGPGATQLKLMQFDGAARSDQRFIHSTLGFSYITLFVKDTDAAMARLARAGIQPLAKGPYALPEDLAPGLYLTVVRDPDGNFVELVGPRQAEKKN